MTWKKWSLFIYDQAQNLTTFLFNIQARVITIDSFPTNIHYDEETVFSLHLWHQNLV